MFFKLKKLYRNIHILSPFSFVQHLFVRIIQMYQRITIPYSWLLIIPLHKILQYMYSFYYRSHWPKTHVLASPRTWVILQQEVLGRNPELTGYHPLEKFRMILALSKVFCQPSDVVWLAFPWFTNKVEKFFISLLPIWIVSFVKYLLGVSLIFLLDYLP